MCARFREPRSLKPRTSSWPRRPWPTPAFQVASGRSAWRSFKEICRRGGLARSGNKPELQRRIVDVLTTTSRRRKRASERICGAHRPEFLGSSCAGPDARPSLADQLLASGQARQVVVRAPPLENAAPSTSAGRDRRAALDPFLPLVDGSSTLRSFCRRGATRGSPSVSSPAGARATTSSCCAAPLRARRRAALSTAGRWGRNFR